jgi:hypothetical protein
MMNNKGGWCSTGAIVALLSFSSIAEAGGPVQGERLFRITRNKNDNIVCYDVLHKDGKLLKDGPVSVYWMIPSKKNALEGLNFLERTRAYGVSVEKMFGQDSADFTLKSGKKQIRITKRDSRWVALTAVAGLEVAIDSVFVMADESGAMPAVKYAEIIGRNPATGEMVRKRLTP